MPRRFALALLALLILLLLGLLVGRRIQEARQKRQVAARPTPTRTIPPPPTPIPARLVSIWFGSAEDDFFHPEAREVPAAVDDVAFLRSLASAVLEGPRHPALLKPFPDGWKLRAAFRLADGLAVLDLAPPVQSTPIPTPPPEPSPARTDGKKGAKKQEPTPTSPPPVPIAEPPKRWETGSSEEVGAVQSLVLTVTKNLHSISRVILLVGGEPVETLAGHVDLTHPLLPDLSRAADEAPLVAPMPEPSSAPEPVASPSMAPAGVPSSAAPPASPPPPAASPVPSPRPVPVAPAPRPTASPTPRPAKDTFRT